MLIRTSSDLLKVLESKNELYPVHFITVNNKLISFEVVEQNKEKYIETLNNKFEANGYDLISESKIFWDGLYVCSVSGLKLNNGSNR